MFLNLIIFGVIALFSAAYLYVKHSYSYWERKGVTYIEPKFYHGNLPDSTQKVGRALYFKSLYEKLKAKGNGKYGGLYFLLTPIFVVLDLDLLKTVLVKDFNTFVNRGVFYNEKDDPLTGHLFALEDDKWRNLRAKLSPTFSSGKMKGMHPIIVTVAEEFRKFMQVDSVTNPEIEMKETLARFTTDVIGTCAFGIECNSLKDPNAIFRKMGRQIFEQPISRMKLIFLGNYASLGRKLGLVQTPVEISKFFLNVVDDTINYRISNNVQRNDFMGLLIKLLKDPANGKVSEIVDGLTNNEAAAQAFVFFLAGFETSSTTMSFSLLELAQNQEIQSKARKEVLDVLAKHDNELTYEAMMEMKYLEQVINESLRKYPPVPDLNRVCNKDYKVPNSDVVLEKGTKIFLPVYAIQQDPEYYPNPSEFNPDRFNDEETKKRNPYTFLPFGDGPRNCIGLRFGMMQAKIGLVTILKNFQFTLGSKTQMPIELKVKSFITSIEGGLWLKLKEIK